MVPLQHGGMHPLTRREPKGDGAVGRVVAAAAFVAIQGYQAGHSPWPHAGRFGPDPDIEWSPLPDWLVRALEPDQGKDAWSRIFDLDYLVALEDRRMVSALSLKDDASSAAVDPKGCRVRHVGPDGRKLRDRLLQLADMWVGLGRPAKTEYSSTFTPTTPNATAAPNAPLSWVVDRLDYRQVVSLSRGEPVGNAAP